MYDRGLPGFGIRITNKGARSFIFMYFKAGKRHRVTSGRVGEIDLDKAREQARQLRAQVRAGQPVENRPPATTATFRDVVDLYTKRDLVGKRSGNIIRQTIDRELMRAWGNRSIASITRGDVLEVVEALVDAGKPEAGRRLFGFIGRLFNWAISRGTFGIDRSPCDRLRPTDIIGSKPVRTRILTDDELRTLWATTEKMGYPFGPMIRLLMLTGLRRNEVAESCWTEFDLDSKAIWTIPAERMKGQNGTAAAHVVPLTADMLAIIEALPRIDDGEFLFMSRRGDRPVSGFSQMKERLDQLMVGGATDWTVHDIRRTMRTHLSSLPVPGGDLVRELMLAHSRPGLHRVYDQFGYLEERRRAYELWGAKLMAIVKHLVAPTYPPAAPTTAPAV